MIFYLLLFFFPLIPLYGNGNIIGQVTDRVNNTPLAGIKIDVMRGKQIIQSTLTDSGGNYQFVGLPSIPHIFRIKNPSFETHLKLRIPSPDQTTTINFVMHYPSGVLTGQIIDKKTKKPIPLAILEIIEDDCVVDLAETNSEGIYIFPEIKTHQTLLRIRASEYKAISQNVFPLSRQTVSANFSLEPYESLVGTITHAFTGAPIVKASIGLWENNALFASTVTDANGHYHLRANGHYQMVVQYRHFYTRNEAIHVSPNQTTTFNLSLTHHVPRPPEKVIGKMIQSKKAGQTTQMCQIKWSKSKDRSVIGYRIYRNDIKVGKVFATDPLVFEEACPKKKPQTYHVKSFNAFKQESPPVVITIKPTQ